MEIISGVWKLTFGTPEDGVPSQQNYVKPPQTEAIKKLPRPAEPPFALGSIRFSTDARGCRLELPMTPGEDIYGLGLQLKSIRHTGKKRTLRVNSDPVTDTGDSHAPAPLYFSTAGYGILIDTARYASFYCGGNQLFDPNDNSSNKTEKKGIALTEAELYAGAKNSIAPMVIDIPAAPGVDIYIFSGPSMLEAVRRYVLYCGGGCLPPEWGLGVWYRTCGTHDQAKIEKMAEELRREHIPCDVLGLEPGWQSKAYSCSYAWSGERFPQPENMLSELKKQHYRVNLWEHVFVHPESPLHEPLSPYAGEFKVWEGLVPDFTIPEAGKQFADYHHQNFTAKGISSFKLDECDNSDFISSPWSFPECSRFPSGLDGEQMHSMIGLLYQEVIDRACRQGGIRTYGSVRSSHAFAPPQPFVLYSDLYQHSDFIRGVVNCGFSGMLWTPELRHAASPEDYVRRLQAMVLSPQMLLNIWSMPSPPWYQLDQKRNRAGEFLPEAEQSQLREYTREVLKLRQSFIPYLYTSFAAYHFEGTPPVRALVMDFPEETALREIDYAWMAGPDLLVIPFTAGTVERVIPLPPGNWYDFYTGKKYTGEATLQPDLATLPIMVRENSIIPLAEPVEYVTDGMKYQLTLRLYGNDPKPVRLFADDGVSFGYESGSSVWGEIGKDGTVPAALSTRYAVKNVVNMTE